MKIQDAISSGRPFKRPQYNRYFPAYDPHILFTYDDVQSEDWEVEERKILLSWADIKKAITPFGAKYKGDSGNVYYDVLNIDSHIKSSLGFKE